MKIDNKLVFNRIMNHKRQNLDTMVRDYVRTESYRPRKPKKPTKHLGIEVECFGPYNDIKLQKMLFMFGLDEYVQIGHDGSIRSPRGMHKYELRLLLTENRLPSIMLKIGKFFKAAQLKTNASCGLHVHLDMRHRRVEDCYRKLLKFQDVLYSLVHKQRWTNQYCRYAEPHMRYDKYRAITMSSYSSKRTIEVRLHHGTTNVVEIEKWVRLLINAINAPEVQTSLNSKAAILGWKSLKPELKPYLKKKLREHWFKKKEAADARLIAQLEAALAPRPTNTTTTGAA